MLDTFRVIVGEHSGLALAVVAPRLDGDNADLDETGHYLSSV